MNISLIAAGNELANDKKGNQSNLTIEIRRFATPKSWVALAFDF